MLHTCIHDDVSLSSPLKRIERKILQLLPVSEVLYSTDLTYVLSHVKAGLDIASTRSQMRLKF